MRVGAGLHNKMVNVSVYDAVNRTAKRGTGIRWRRVRPLPQLELNLRKWFTSSENGK